MSKGRGFGTHRKGEPIADIGCAQTGALLLEHSNQFDADNVLFVTREFAGRVWAVFVDPSDWTQRDGHEFCIWQHDIELGTVNLWRVAY